MLLRAERSAYFTVTVTQPRRDLTFMSSVVLVVQNLSDARKPGFSVSTMPQNASRPEGISSGRGLLR